MYWASTRRMVMFIYDISINPSCKVFNATNIDFNENNLNKNIKKKMNENQLRMLANLIFHKGQYLYFRALFKTICVLHNRKLFDNKF